jgi:hypothetical protein
MKSLDRGSLAICFGEFEDKLYFIVDGLEHSPDINNGNNHNNEGSSNVYCSLGNFHWQGPTGQLLLFR